MRRAVPAWAPPEREGVGASRIAVAAGPWATVLDFLLKRLPGAAAEWPARLARGDVLDAFGRPVAADSACVPGTLLWYWRSLPDEPRLPFELELLYQDAHLVVVDKPHFLPVTPGGRYLQDTALVRLKRQLGITTLAPMHRLDRDTAGVLLFSIQPGCRDLYQALWRDRQVHKVYEAVAPWRGDLVLPMTCRSRLVQRPGAAFMQMQVVAGEPNAETRIELIGRIESPPGRPGLASQDRAAGSDGPAPGGLAHYRLIPLTGRKHQLRAQLSALGLPIVGDRLYPRLLPEPAPDAVPDYTQALQLLARELAFTDPISGRPQRFVSRRQLALSR